MYKGRIPNGENVPHPCKDSIWNGVGHENEMGSGARNIFGKEFKENNFVWDQTFCRKDSDGDGKTNGEELGDPDCEWTKGAKPKYTTNLSHPGICEPFTLEQCGGRPSFVDCNEAEKCEAIHEADTFNYTITFDRQPVPTKETTYMCITFEFPTDKDYHLVAHEPIIDTEDVMHHTLVYGCDGVVDEPPSPLLTPKECGGEMRSCTSILALWSVGISGGCYDDQMGFLVGNSGFKYAIMQVHWNNPDKVPGYIDSSGIILYLTPKLRPNNAGVLMIGQTKLDIPPLVQSVIFTGECPGSCTSKMMEGPINVSVAINHMHLLGYAQRTDIIYKNVESPVADDQVYDYNTPVLHIHKTPMKVNPGDGLKTSCHFSSMDRTNHTKFGQATADEMCFAFLIYYPKENLRENQCISWKSIDYCEYRYQNVIRDCDIYKMADVSNKETLEIYDRTNRACVANECKPDCLKEVREIKKHPCFVGDVGDFFRSILLQFTKADYLVQTFFAKFDSCNAELAREKAVQEEIEDDDGSTSEACRHSHELMTSLILYFVVFNTLRLFA
ncbi:hypothetical protein ACF0H5_021332 [Mactra antiquata]